MSLENTIIAFIGLGALGYLAWRFIRPQRRGCGKGCGCGPVPPPRPEGKSPSGTN